MPCGRTGARMDVLFLHTPKFSNHYKPIGEFTFVLFPPIGLLGLADYLRTQGRTSRIIHLGVERHVSGSLDYSRIVAEHTPSIIGLDLHWHFQSYDVMRVASAVRQAAPGVPILLGGMTASFFAEEILRDHPCVDFIIRGEGEVPLCELLRRCEGDRDLSQVPNLAWRQPDGTVVLNPCTAVADSALIDSIRYTDFTLMKDYRTFIDSFSRYMHMPDLSERTQRLLFRWNKAYQVYMGRGCINGCSYCGGSRDAHELIAGRHAMVMRSPQAILASLVDLQAFGFNMACLALDGFADSCQEDTYFEIFEGIRKTGLTLDIEVERWQLPSQRFIESFSRLPGRNSFLTISPHTPNEELRRRNHLYRYSNDELENSLADMDRAGVNVLLCFTCALPFETMDDLREMAAYQRRLRQRYAKLRFKSCMIEIEPGSAMSRDPAGYGIEPARRTFADYYHYHSLPARNHWQETGYERPGYPSTEEVATFFCTHFCERFKAGCASPAVCSAVSALWSVGAFSLLDRVLRPRPRRQASRLPVPSVASLKAEG